MIATSQAATLRALASRLRTRVARSSHKSEVLELIDLLDVALAEDLAPAALPVSEQSPPATPAVEAASPADAAVEGAGACALPSGWYRDHDVSSAPVNRDYEHATGGTWRMQVWHGDGVWQWAKDGGSTRGTAPTMLTAMCAALGIAVENRGTWRFRLPGPDTLVRCGFADADSCAGQALEAFHTRQLASLRAEADEMRSAARELTASMRPATSAAPTVERLLELAAEAVKVAADMRAAALDAEGWAARVRAAAGGER